MDSFSCFADRGLMHACCIEGDGRLVELSEPLCNELGYTAADIQGCELELLFTADSARLLRRLLASPPADEKLPSLELTLLRQSENLYPTLGCGLLEWRNVAKPRLRLVLMPLGALGHKLGEAKSANEVMSQMLHSAKVAFWCIEFAEPVDVTLSADEVVRQVFENRSYWRMCNRAMTEVYEMPAGVDFSQQPVRLYWPRSPANEEFVRRLVETDFCVDGALSVDRRHDGSPAYVENDVRAAIHNGRLLRMWGSIRDVSRELRMQHDAEQRIESLRRVFDAVPDAVLVIDDHAQPQWRNMAFEGAFGITQGASVAAQVVARALPERTWHELRLPNISGQGTTYNVHCSNVLMTEGVAWRVVVLRACEHGRPSLSEMHP